MYKVYVIVEQRFLLIGDKTVSTFKEEDLDVLKQQQEKSFSIGRPMWIVYLNQEKKWFTEKLE